MIRRISIFMVLVIAGVVAFVVIQGGDDAQPPRYEVYVDATGTAADRLHGPIAASVANLVKRAKEERAPIALHPLTDATASAVEIGHADFHAPPDDVAGEYYEDGWVEEEEDRLMEEFTSWREGVEPIEGTDVLGALINASGPTSAETDREVHVILITDGLNYTPEWMWSDGPLDADGCRDLVDEIGLPDLEGAVMSIRTGGHQKLDTGQAVSVEECWKALLNELGADTPAGWFHR